MTTYTLEEAQAELRIVDVKILCRLVRTRKIGYYKTRPVTFSADHIKEYQKSIEVKPCVASRNLPSSETLKETSNLPIGTSNISTEKEVNVALRAVKSARKTMKRKSSSRILFSNVNDQASERQANL